MHRKFNVRVLPHYRGITLVRSVLAVAVVASVAMFPSVSSAEAGSSAEPTEYRSVELYIEGHEPRVLISGVNLDLSKEGVRSLAQEYVSENAPSGSTAMDGTALHVPGWIVCDRFTRIWSARLPYESVVGRIGADCFGHFSWVQVTGALWIAQDNGTNRIIEWEYDSADGELNRSVDVSLLTTPRARCYDDDIEVWFGRNDMVVTFHSGSTRYFQMRETDWHLIACET